MFNKDQTQQLINEFEKWSKFRKDIRHTSKPHPIDYQTPFCQNNYDCDSCFYKVFYGQSCDCDGYHFDLFNCSSDEREGADVYIEGLENILKYFNNSKRKIENERLSR